MSLELELQADRLRRERLVQALAVLGAAAGAAFMFWVFRADASGPLETADGRTVRLELTTWSWIRGNLWGVILAVIAIVALVKLVRTARELSRVRAALSADRSATAPSADRSATAES